jgi:hypothetical protein
MSLGAIGVIKLGSEFPQSAPRYHPNAHQQLIALDPKEKSLKLILASLMSIVNMPL